MFLGVPYVPFFMAAGACILLTFYVNMFCLALLPVVLFVMRQMARRDEMIFRLLGLRWQFRAKARSSRRFPGAWSFSPTAYRRIDLSGNSRGGSTGIVSRRIR